MALIHHLYIGHFIPEQGYVRFQGHKPAVTRPISTSMVARLLRGYLGDDAIPAALPDDWATTILPDCIVCDHLGSAPAALRFAADYAEQEGATIVDLGAFSLLSPEQLRPSTAIPTLPSLV